MVIPWPGHFVRLESGSHFAWSTVHLQRIWDPMGRDGRNSDRTQLLLVLPLGWDTGLVLFFFWSCGLFVTSPSPHKSFGLCLFFLPSVVVPRSSDDFKKQMKLRMSASRLSLRTLLKTYRAVPSSVRGGNGDAYNEHNPYAPFPGGTDTGMGFSYLRMIHVASTAWTGLAMLYQTTDDDKINAEANPFQLSKSLPQADSYCLPEQQVPESFIADQACTAGRWTWDRDELSKKISSQWAACFTPSQTDEWAKVAASKSEVIPWLKETMGFSLFCTSSLI